MTTNVNIVTIEASLVAAADEIHEQLAAKRQERKALDAEIKELVGQHKKAERLAKVVRREIAKQTDIDETVASVTPAVAPAIQSVS